MIPSKRHKELMKVVAKAKTYLKENKMKLASGLYLNEDNGQTFEVVDTGKFSAYVQYPDFFFTSVVHADEDMDNMLDLVFEGKISYIGEV